VSESLKISELSVGEAVAAALEACATASSLEELKRAKTAHLGEKSTLSALNATLRDVPADQKASAGKLMGSAKADVQAAFAEAEAHWEALEEQQSLVSDALDLTALGSHRAEGARHPLSVLMEDMADVFVSMGWEIAEGPELEHEWFNFDALNFDADHPARAMQDTFFVDPVSRHMVLRTHTSPVQVRSLLERELPVYVVAPGRVYRTDELDATHTPVFHQIEGIAIDRDLTMAHLRGTLEHLARAMFGPEAKIRLRANYFPFTEPSAELDIWHPTFIGGARWIEWGGCGMVNPNVLRAAGIDPDEYQGFAFGMGIERTLMFRNNVQDMRDMVEGDIRFSGQFGMVV
jgi:phenylalanyl-tRNA synthetase alpha chain